MKFSTIFAPVLAVLVLECSAQALGKIPPCFQVSFSFTSLIVAIWAVCSVKGDYQRLAFPQLSEIGQVTYPGSGRSCLIRCKSTTGCLTAVYVKNKSCIIYSKSTSTLFAGPSNAVNILFYDVDCPV